MKKNILILAVPAVMLALHGTLVYADKINPEVGDGVYDGYNLTSKMIDELYTCGNEICWDYLKDENKVYYLKSFDIIRSDILYGKIKVPDRINNKTIEYIRGSCYLQEFDLNPENPYMKCVDNVIFSKDGTKLMSYARYDERTEYIIPQTTETIGAAAFFDCNNLKSVVIPDSVNNIGNGAFSCSYNIEVYDFSDNVTVIPANAFSSNRKLKMFIIKKESKLKEIKSEAFDGCPMLSELYLPSFDIKIDKWAFGHGTMPKTKLKSYVQTKVTADENTLNWKEVQNTSYYEIYQKLNSGEYKLLGKTKKTSYEFKALKNGMNYTFAVKPLAVIPAANYDKDNDKYYPETFTIEGTMSEDIVISV
ncbi:MAG: leucine-rich repeat domain-containing protein [Oscillospiraceae bacterium]|nr:leucine-rich repeat domain-containing protein [Oscillospiraceae bacterium]